MVVRSTVVDGIELLIVDVDVDVDIDIDVDDR